MGNAMKKITTLVIISIMLLSLSGCIYSTCFYCGTDILISRDDYLLRRNYCEDCKIELAHLIEERDESLNPIFHIPDENELYNTPDEQFYNSEEPDSKSLSIDDMEDCRPYLLCNSKISMIDEFERTLGCIDDDSLSRIPVVTADSSIIIRSASVNLDDITVYALDIAKDLYINPCVRFVFTPYSGELTFQSMRYPGSSYCYYRDLENAMEVDNIDGIYDSYDMPIMEYQVNFADSYSYYLYSYGEQAEYSVGYWEGTNYKEIELSTQYIPVSYESAHNGTDYIYSCDCIRTYDGYSIVNLSELLPGYYVLQILNSRDYAIYIE